MWRWDAWVSEASDVSITEIVDKEDDHVWFRRACRVGFFLSVLLTECEARRYAGSEGAGRGVFHKTATGLGIVGIGVLRVVHSG